MAMPSSARRKPPIASEMPASYAASPDGSLTYVDTSVWMALLAREAPAPALTLWLGSAPALCCADWTQVEMASTLGIKHRRGEISMDAAQSICSVFSSMMTYQIREIALGAPDMASARSLCLDMERGLRSADALHLAAALRFQCSHFFSFDHNLNRNAELAGLRLTTL